MNDYYEAKIKLAPCSEDATDLLAALLGEVGYESFVPQPDGLLAYVKAEHYDARALEAALADFPFDCQATWQAELIPGRDWNEEWERNYFQPITVMADGKPAAVVHSSFHTDVPAVPFDIVIDPKMAFGTGHHATTAQIMGRLLTLPIRGKRVTDMGTGTGILAILAAMRGAMAVQAVEIDPAAHANAVENAALNGHPEISIALGDASALADMEPCDIFIANINRNIVIADLPAYARALLPGGIMLLSGFFEEDIPLVCDAAEAQGLVFDMATSAASPADDPRTIAERPLSAGAPKAASSDALPGTYGAVASAPGSAWACLQLRKPC